MTIAVVCLGPIGGPRWLPRWAVSNSDCPEGAGRTTMSASRSLLRRAGCDLETVRPGWAEITLSSGRVLLVASLPAGCRRCSLTHGLP